MTIELIGSAQSTPQVNKLANTVKNAIYFVGNDKENELLPFSGVVLNTIANDEDRVNFNMQFLFEPAIFNNHEKIELRIPEIDSTNSEVNRPEVNAEVFNNSGDQ